MERVVSARRSSRTQALRLLEPAAAGEASVVTKHGRPISRLVPLGHGSQARGLSGCMRVVEPDDDLDPKAEWEAAEGDWEPR